MRDEGLTRVLIEDLSCVSNQSHINAGIKSVKILGLLKLKQIK